MKIGDQTIDAHIKSIEFLPPMVLADCDPEQV